MKNLIIAAIIVLPSAAIGQTAPNIPFEPWTVTAAQHDELTKYLADVPYKFSAPIFGWIQAREAEAVQEKAKAAAVQVQPPAKE